MTVNAIMGLQVGFELYDSERDGDEIGYLLIDILVIRIQFAWFK